MNIECSARILKTHNKLVMGIPAPHIEPDLIDSPYQKIRLSSTISLALSPAVLIVTNIGFVQKYITEYVSILPVEKMKSNKTCWNMFLVS